MTEHDALLNLAAELGSGLMQNGAETSRVEESVRRFVNAYHESEVEVFAVANCIILSITLDDASTIMKQKRVLKRRVNLQRVSRLNNLCRRACAARPPLEQVRTALEGITQQKDYPDWVLVMSSALAAGAFTLLFGGGWQDALCSLAIGAVLRVVCELLRRMGARDVFVSIVGGGLVMAGAMSCVSMGIVAQADKTAIGALMNLVPGVALMISMRDLISGDYFSGQLRLIEALMTATALALGAGVVMAAF